MRPVRRLRACDVRLGTNRNKTAPHIVNALGLILFVAAASFAASVSVAADRGGAPANEPGSSDDALPLVPT
ncbi:MAG TPA: hypothetical protein VN720_00105, partial [Rudaea sp.]|nr:hypothetical protein [Rudaea sp.]